jgi:hypothetical protein
MSVTDTITEARGPIYTTPGDSPGKFAPSRLQVFEEGVEPREVGAVPPAAVPVGKERGVRGFVLVVGTWRACGTAMIVRTRVNVPADVPH